MSMTQPLDTLELLRQQKKKTPSFPYENDTCCYFWPCADCTHRGFLEHIYLLFVYHVNLCRKNNYSL